MEWDTGIKGARGTILNGFALCSHRIVFLVEYSEDTIGWKARQQHAQKSEEALNPTAHFKN